jgi:hypothetical protein
MKKLIVLIIATVTFLGLSAQKAFFPYKEGTKLTYQTIDKKGKLSQEYTYTVKKLTGSGNHFTIVYAVEYFNDKGKKLYIDEISARQEGDKMYLDMSNFLNKSAFQQNGEIPASIEITGNNMEIPLVPVPGTTLPDANVTMALKMGILTLKMTVNVTNRKVEALENITVKAGNFSAFKLTGNVSGSILGIKVNNQSSDWYAYGVGLVKTESFKKGELQTVMELVKLE